jgi:hypothetical protein
MSRYRYNDKFLNLSEEEIEDDVELFYIDLIDEIGFDNVSNMDIEEVSMLYFTRYLEKSDDQPSENLN